MSNTNIVTFRRHILESENPLYRPHKQPSLNRYYASFFDSWEPQFIEPHFLEPQFIEPQLMKSQFIEPQLMKPPKSKTNMLWILIILLLGLIFLLK